MTARSSLTIVLAAGEGTRMRSSLPKVLHPVASQTLLAHVLGAAPQGTGTALAVVIGPDHQAVADEAKRIRSDALIFVQAERLGTAHAVLAAREAIARGVDDVLIAFGDTPLISAETFTRLRAPLANGAAIAALGFRAADPSGYGRFIVEGDRLVAIREQADASADERKIDLCNAGVMALDGRRALAILDKIGNANSKGEYYLTDAVGIAGDNGWESVVIETSEDEVRGINTKAQLAEAEAVMQTRLRKAAMEAGVTDHVWSAEEVVALLDWGIMNRTSVGVGIGLGLCFGAVLGTAMHNVGVGIALGVGLGVAFATAFGASDAAKLQQLDSGLSLAASHCDLREVATGWEAKDLLCHRDRGLRVLVRVARQQIANVQLELELLAALRAFGPRLEPRAEPRRMQLEQRAVAPAERPVGRRLAYGPVGEGQRQQAAI